MLMGSALARGTNGSSNGFTELGPTLKPCRSYPKRAPPACALWDHAADSVAELKRILDVRRVALQRYGRASIPVGESLAGLRRAFVPIWLLDRYQVEAAAKSLGGVDFPYG